MNICGSNLIPIFITVIFSGLIFFYFNSRLAEVKNTVEKQNRVLTAFIGNIQNDIRGGQCVMPSNASDNANDNDNASAGAGASASAGAGAGANHLASFEALQAVKRNEKIVVSDDEEDSDSDSESSDDDDEPLSIKLEEIVTLDFVQIDSSATPLSTDDLKIVDLDLDLTPDAAVVDITKAEVTGVEQMKVDDLRKMVSDSNLATKDEVKILKKPELLALLKK